MKYNGELFIARHKAINDPNFDSGKMAKMLGKAVDLLNHNYDKDEIAKIVARISLGIGRHSDDQEYICSEFVDECFKQLEIEITHDSKGFIYPEHVEQILTSNLCMKSASYTFCKYLLFTTLLDKIFCEIYLPSFLCGFLCFRAPSYLLTIFKNIQVVYPEDAQRSVEKLNQSHTKDKL